MAEKIMIASGKGGVGKSTLTAFLATEEARRNKKILVIDTDTGLGALDIMLGVADKKMNTWLDVSNGESFEKSVIKVSEKLHLLPSPEFLPDEIPEDVFAEIVKSAENNYDMILIDSAAGIDDSLKRAAKAAERAIFVATADEISVKCAAAAADKAESFGMDRSEMRLIINRFEKKAAQKCRLLNIDGVIDKSGVMLLGILPEDKKIPFSSVTGVLPDKKSKFVKALCRIADRTEGKNVPLVIK